MFLTITIHMKRITIALLILLSISCKKQNTDKWDSIDFYRISKKTEQFFFDTINTSKINEELEELLIGDSSFILNDSVIIRLNKNYLKYTLDSESMTELSKFFLRYQNLTQEASFMLSTTICAPIYRDILVFKKNNKIVGMAKICFDCSQNYLLFENHILKNTPLEYPKLEEYLNQLSRH